MAAQIIWKTIDLYEKRAEGGGPVTTHFGALPAVEYAAHGGRRHGDARFGPVYVTRRRYTAGHDTRIDIMASGPAYDRARVRLLSPGRETFTLVDRRRHGRAAETVATCF